MTGCSAYVSLEWWTIMNSSREDYLQAIFRLSKEKGHATNKEISEYLGVSKASVSEMIKKLALANKVTIEKNQIKLSDHGDKLAKAVLSKHRIWEYFLSEVLHMDSEYIHAQADLLEHVTSDELRDALNKYLGYPTLSPGGKSIFENENI